MQLNNLDTAWKQLKLLNAMKRVESNEILAIIDSYENADGAKPQRVLFNVVMVIVITIVCQGG